MEHKKKIDDLFKSELGSYTETPPPAAWDALEKRLEQTPAGRPRSYAWLGYMAVLCLLITISVLVAKNASVTDEPTALNAATGNAPAATTTALPGTGVASPNVTNTTTETPSTATTDNATGNTDPQKQSIASGTDNATSAGKNANTNNTDHSSNRITGKSIVTKNEPYAGTTTKTIKNKRQANDPSKSRTIATSKKKTGRNTGSKQAYAAVTSKDQETQQQENVYNSSATNNDTEEEAADRHKAEKEKVQEPEQNRSANVPPPPVDAPKPQQNKKHKPKFDHFEAGIKGGYEQGFGYDAASKAVIAPFLQYRITPKLGFMIQPSVKYASAHSRQVGDTNAYYSVNPDGSLKAVTDKVPVHVVGSADSFWIWNYTYTQTHDSVVKTSWTGGQYIEFEMPVLLKYYLADNFSIYGGVNIVYSKLTGLTERTYIEKGIVRTTTQTGIGTINAPAPEPEEMDIVYTGNPISNYKGPQYPAPAGSMIRFGYMLGFSYAFDNRWLLDALVQQTMIRPNVQANFNTYTPLSMPYIRLTLGYKIFK